MFSPATRSFVLEESVKIVVILFFQKLINAEICKYLLWDCEACLFFVLQLAVLHHKTSG